MAADEDWTRHLPAFAGLDPDSRARLRHLSRPIALKAGTWIFREGGACEAYLVVLAGQVRVQKTGANGREIVLYRVGRGEACVITTACLMSGVPYDVDGIAETDVEAQVVPMGAFRDLLSQSEPFRALVFGAFGTRISTLLMRLEDVAFGRIDQRLATWLLAREHREIGVTHQEIALELGTAREVVSRHLKSFENRGLIRLGRGSVTLVDIGALKRVGEELSSL